MTIQTANFVVIRDGENYRCKGSDLPTLLKQTDEMILQRNDQQYRVSFDVGTSKISSVTSVNRDFNFGQYLKIIDPTNGQELTSNQFCDACYSPSLRDPRRLFNGIDDASNRLQYATLGDAQIYSELIIDFPVNIPVYERIEIKAGFHSLARTGQLLINGEVVRELDAWDNDPQVFSANYTGHIDTFSIRMKNLSPRQDPTYSNNTTGAINFIKVDGIQLLDYGTSTRLTMDADTDMSQYRPFMRVYQKGSENITGVIGEVYEQGKTITLISTAPFQAGQELVIDLVEDNTTKVSDIVNTDIFVCTDTDDVTYKVTGEQFKALFASEECVPDTQAYNDAQNQIRTEYSRCRLLCETPYCQSICDDNKANYQWWAETLYKCADPDRPKPNRWTEENPFPL